MSPKSNGRDKLNGSVMSMLQSQGGSLGNTVVTLNQGADEQEHEDEQQLTDLDVNNEQED